MNLSWRRGVDPARLAGVSLAGLALTVVLAVEGQIGPDPQFDPLALTVSDYAVADRGGATDWAMLTLAASTVALAFALPGVSRLARSLLGVFAAGMLVAAVAPTDEGLALSTTGYVHRYASVAAFVVLPAAGLLLARRSASRLGWAAPALRRLATAAVVFMAAMLGSQALAGRALIGLAERLLLAAGVAMLAVLAVRAYQLARTCREARGTDVDLAVVVPHKEGRTATNSGTTTARSTNDGRRVRRGNADTATDGRFPATARASLRPRSRRR